MASLKIQNIKKRYGTLEILKGINLDLADGEFLVLLGPSGCGKSTLLNMIAGLDTVSEGNIAIGERVVNDIHPKDRDIAMVFQSYALYPNMTVRKNISFGLEMRKVPELERQGAIDKVAAMLQITHLLERKPAQLSGGQRQRVAMGRALVRDPKVFLFDEPLSNLDAKLRVDMRTEIKKLHQRLKTTIVYVTHDQIEAMTLATRIAVMKEGVVQQFADPQTIYEQPANMFVAGFIGSPAMNFIHGTLVQEEGGIGVSIARKAKGENSRVLLRLAQLSKTAQAYIGREVVLGVRPETMTCYDAAEVARNPHNVPFECEVEVLEPTGADTMTFLHLGGREAIARVRPRDVVPAGQTGHFMVDMSRASLFDPQTEMRL
jgi:multiple sugar transport system ATP-binding protein